VPLLGWGRRRSAGTLGVHFKGTEGKEKKEKGSQLAT